MNPATQTLPDVQEQADAREVALDEVGISGLSYPVRVLVPDGDSQDTVAEVEMTASLAAAVRGTHMSRFVEVLHDARERVAPATAVEMAEQLRQCLERRTGAGQAAASRSSSSAKRRSAASARCFVSTAGSRLRAPPTATPSASA